MKILLPVHHFPPRYTAGAELYTYRLARWLNAHGHVAQVVCFESIERGPVETLDVSEETYDGIAVWRVTHDLMRSPKRREFTYHHALLGEWFAQFLAAQRPDLAHFQAGYLIGTAPLLAMRAAGIPALLTLHDYWFICPRHTLLRGDGSLCEQIPEDPRECVWCHERLWESRTRKLNALTGGLAHKAAIATMPDAQRARMQARRDLTAQALAVPAYVISPSHFLATRFRPWVDDARLRVIRLGLDLTPFEQLPARAIARPNAPLRIGFIGQIAPHKGVHLLIEAFGALRTAQRPLELHIYGGMGDDAYATALNHAAGRDPRITLHGRFDNAGVARILADLDTLVVPSTWYENMPLSILEAYAAGTPVVTTSTGGMAEPVTHDVNGLHFAFGSAVALAAQLQRLVDSPELLDKLQKNAKHNKPCSIDTEMEQLLSLYAKVCNI